MQKNICACLAVRIVMKHYKFGIIGCGRMGWLFNEDKLIDQPISHIAAYSINKQTRITAVCDINRERVKSISKQYSIKKVYTDYKRMLANEEIDILSICTPTILHSEICVVAAGYGVKAIFCEKPMAASLQEAEKMIRTCRRNNVKLAINHTKRWDIPFPWHVISLNVCLEKETLDAP